MFVENDSFLLMLLENGCIVVLVKIRMNGFDEDYLEYIWKRNLQERMTEWEIQCSKKERGYLVNRIELKSNHGYEYLSTHFRRLYL